MNRREFMRRAAIGAAAAVAVGAGVSAAVAEPVKHTVIHASEFGVWHNIRFMQAPREPMYCHPDDVDKPARDRRYGNLAAWRHLERGRWAR